LALWHLEKQSLQAKTCDDNRKQVSLISIYYYNHRKMAGLEGFMLLLIGFLGLAGWGWEGLPVGGGSD
jgi:hypothetical protein